MLGFYCKECGKEILPEEYKYSMIRYSQPLCRIHQSDNFEEQNGLSKRESKYKEGMIKGRILLKTVILFLFQRNILNVLLIKN